MKERTENKVEIGRIKVPEDLYSIDYNGKLVVGEYIARWCSRNGKRTVFEIRKPGLLPLLAEVATLGYFVKRVSMNQKEMAMVSFEEPDRLPM